MALSLQARQGAKVNGARKVATLPPGSLLSLMIVLIVILLPPSLLREEWGKRAFDDSHVKQLTALRPDYVFIGSSTMVSRIDANHLSELRPGETGYILGDVGSLTSLWYLWLKNSLIQSKINPKRVFILFRDTDLTNPEEETNTLINKKKIAKNSLGDEVVFNTILNYHKSPQDHLRDWLLDVYPIQETWRDFAFWFLDSICLSFSMPGYAHYQWNRIFHPEKISQSDANFFLKARFDFKREMAQRLFHSGNQRVFKVRAAYSDPSDKRYDFDKRVAHSFLPEMIRLAKEASLKLVFVRLESMPNMDGSPKVPSSETLDYLSKLIEYLKKEEVDFHDFEGDRDFEWAMYLDGGHIKAAYKKFYTEHLVKTLPEYFK